MTEMRRTVAVLDREGDSLPLGVVGQVAIRVPGELPPNLQADVRNNGNGREQWLRTPYLGLLDAAGDLVITGMSDGHGDRSAVFPVSSKQQGLWIFDQLQPHNSTYNIAQAYRLRGPVHVGALEQALNEVVRRHAILRTTFDRVGGRTGSSCGATCQFFRANRQPPKLRRGGTRESGPATRP